MTRRITAPESVPPMTALPPARRDSPWPLTDNDRQLIAQIREAAAVLRARSSDFDRLTGWRIKELADLAERLAGEQR